MPSTGTLFHTPHGASSSISMTSGSPGDAEAAADGDDKREKDKAVGSMKKAIRAAAGEESSSVSEGKGGKGIEVAPEDFREAYPRGSSTPGRRRGTRGSGAVGEVSQPQCLEILGADPFFCPQFLLFLFAIEFFFFFSLTLQ